MTKDLIQSCDLWVRLPPDEPELYVLRACRYSIAYAIQRSFTKFGGGYLHNFSFLSPSFSEGRKAWFVQTTLEIVQDGTMSASTEVLVAVLEKLFSDVAGRVPDGRNDHASLFLAFVTGGM